MAAFIIRNICCKFMWGSLTLGSLRSSNTATSFLLHICFCPQTQNWLASCFFIFFPLGLGITRFWDSFPQIPSDFDSCNINNSAHFDQNKCMRICSSIFPTPQLSSFCPARLFYPEDFHFLAATITSLALGVLLMLLTHLSHFTTWSSNFW